MAFITIKLQIKLHVCRCFKIYLLHFRKIVSYQQERFRSHLVYNHAYVQVISQVNCIAVVLRSRPEITIVGIAVTSPQNYLIFYYHRTDRIRYVLFDKLVTA